MQQVYIDHLLMCKIFRELLGMGSPEDTGVVFFSQGDYVGLRSLLSAKWASSKRDR